MTNKMTVPFEEYKALFDAFEEAKTHLEWTGYGDSWERECAYDGNLPQTIDKAYEMASAIIEKHTPKVIPSTKKNDLPFKCEYCGKKFRETLSLDKHLASTDSHCYKTRTGS